MRLRRGCPCRGCSHPMLWGSLVLQGAWGALLVCLTSWA